MTGLGCRVHNCTLKKCIRTKQGLLLPTSTVTFDFSFWIVAWWAVWPGAEGQLCVKYSYTVQLQGVSLVAVGALTPQTVHDFRSNRSTQELKYQQQ